MAAKKTPAKKTLVIVESPSKAKTIGKFLGSRYKVVASVGHVRDLPKSKLGIDIENDFEPQYINIRGKGPIIRELKKEAKKASKIYLATDLDRVRTHRAGSFLMRSQKRRSKKRSRTPDRSISVW